MKYKNTLQKGTVRYIVLKEADTWYGVGLEFNIVIEADTKEVALFNLFDAIRGYVNSARKIGGVRPDILNQSVAKEYEELWQALNTNKPVPSPYQVDTFGTRILTNA